MDTLSFFISITKLTYSHHINIPAKVALKRLAKVPAITALNPILATSSFRFGSIPPSPPIKIAIDDILANPHKAKVIIATVLGSKDVIIGPNLLKATNSFNMSFCPIRDPAVRASLRGTPITRANG